MTMQAGYEKTSVSLPAGLMDYLKGKSERVGAPVSRLIAEALREKMTREEKAKKGARK